MGRWYGPLLATVAALAGGLVLGCAPGESVFVIDLDQCDSPGDVRQVQITLESEKGDSAEATYDLDGTLEGTLGARIPSGLGELTVSAWAILYSGERVPLGSGTTDGSSTVNPCSYPIDADGGPDGGDGPGPDRTGDGPGPDELPDANPTDRTIDGDGCQPKTCPEGMCGMLDDGCGGQVECAPCGSDQTCNTGTNQCECTDAARASCGGSCVLVDSDSNHCGACDHTCRGGGCLNGVCQSVLVGMTQNRPTEIATDESGVYWINAGPATAPMGQVIAMPVAAAFPAPTQVIADTLDDPTQLVLAPTEAFVLSGNNLTRLSKTNAHAPEPMPTVQASLLSTFDGFVYMSEYGGAVARLPWDAGAVGVARATANYGIAGMVAGEEGLFFACFECTPISLYNFQTDEVTGLVPGAGVTENSIALAPGRIYWSSYNGDVFFATRSGADPTVVATAPGTGYSVRGLATDELYVYWAWITSSNGTLYRQTRDGLNPLEVIADDVYDLGGVAVGPLGVFWTRTSRGEIHFLAR